ncbi:MAG: hypothetical protein ACFFG0_03055 [Candidatus Thorarchaeota archaeon]
MEESYQKLAETEPNSLRGSSLSTYLLLPSTYTEEVLQAAKGKTRVAQWALEATAPKGSHDVIIRKRTQFKGYYGNTWNTAGSDIGGSGAGTGPYANTIADISWTTVDNYDGVKITPMPVILGRAIQNFGMDTNAINILEEEKTELSVAVAQYLEYNLITTIGDATNSTSTAAGAQTLFGGNATSSATLSAGDIITTDLITDAGTKLEDLQFGYRASGAYGADTLVAISSYRKNPWNRTDGEFVLFIGPKQKAALLKDSQFMNAAEFGRDILIREGREADGFFAKYEGIYLIDADLLERTAASGTAPDTQTAAVACTQCLMIVAKKGAAIGWGKRPETRIWAHNERDETRMGTFMYVAFGVPYTDAVIKILVADD